MNDITVEIKSSETVAQRVEYQEANTALNEIIEEAKE